MPAYYFDVNLIRSRGQIPTASASRTLQRDFATFSPFFNIQNIPAKNDGPQPLLNLTPLNSLETLVYHVSFFY